MGQCHAETRIKEVHHAIGPDLHKIPRLFFAKLLAGRFDRIAGKAGAQRKCGLLHLVIKNLIGIFPRGSKRDAALKQGGAKDG